MRAARYIDRNLASSIGFPNLVNGIELPFSVMPEKIIADALGLDLLILRTDGAWGSLDNRHGTPSVMVLDEVPNVWIWPSHEAGSACELLNFVQRIGP